ncbi:MAG: TylF/MycF/NovP-related O-methyltransferase [Patescibacteria group bacterium]
MQIIKNLIRESQLYQKLRFWSGISPQDFFNFEKLWLFLKVYPYTMSGYKRLSNVYQLAKKIEGKKINGAFVECGVWKGGCSAIMAFVAKKYNSNRKTWLFDSFEGLPEPTKEDGLVAKEYAGNKTEGKLQTIEQCVASLKDVKEVLFEVLRLKKDNIVIEKGWFQNTLPKAREKIGKISILRLDGDWYESTKCCLDNLYDNVIVGGYIIIDDYGHWEGAKKALEEFFLKRNVRPDLIKIDYTGVYFKKP